MGTLQVGGTTLGVKNTVTNKVDLNNAGDVNISGDITKDSLPMYACRAWVNFDGGDTSSTNPLSFTNTNATNHGDANSAGETLCAIRGSGNVSKVVRNDTGDYTVHFTTAMPDENYSTSAFAAQQSGVADNNVIVVGQKGTVASNYTTSGCRLQMKRLDNNISDIDVVSASFFR